MSFLLLILCIFLAFIAGMESVMSLNTIESWVLPVILMIIALGFGVAAVITR
jgi:hypothetical protein